MKYPLSMLLLLSCYYTSTSYAQTCEPSTTATSSDSHYILKNNGTVFDKTTNLTWMRCALGQTWSNNTCNGVPQLMSWETALETAKNANFVSAKDWRVPTQEELQSLLEQNCEDPTINITAFPNFPPTSVYWSSSEINNNGAWAVNFFDGDDYWSYKYDDEAVRLVHTGMIEAAPDCSTSDDDKDGINNCKDKCPNSITESKVDDLGCPISVELKGVQFKLDSAELTDNSKQILDQVSKNLINYADSQKTIEVQGYTCSEATNSYNLKLSQRRAQSVLNYLKKQGVKNKLHLKGYGEDYPVADNKTRDGRVKNRRVELHWLNK
jgi:outer membrane protein OmpA-like peptidoglycan-associated protein